MPARVRRTDQPGWSSGRSMAASSPLGRADELIARGWAGIERGVQRLELGQRLAGMARAGRERGQAGRRAVIALPRYAYQAAAPMCGDHGMGVDRPSCTIAAFAPGC